MIPESIKSSSSKTAHTVQRVARLVLWGAGGEVVYRFRGVPGVVVGKVRGALRREPAPMATRVTD